MSILLNLVLLFILAVLLVKSADLLSESFVVISHKLEISTFITGFVILSFVSSLPEISVAINSATAGFPELSVGNLLGSTIVMLTLVIGLNAIKHKTIPFGGSFGVEEVLFSLLLIGAQLLVIADGSITVLEGIALLTGYGLLVIRAISKAKGRIHKENITNYVNGSIYYILAKAIVGIIGLAIVSRFIVTTSLDLATLIGVPELLIGIFILGIGTDLPELTLLVRSNSVDKEKLAVGNFIGSATFKPVVLGFLAIIMPHQIVNFANLLPIIILLTITIVIFAIMTITDRKITSREGYILLSFYIILIVSEIFINYVV
jgi:cation:H+ antiporter